MEQISISPDWIVEEILREWPETIPVFLKYRMGCVGCSMAIFERLADALIIYAVPADVFMDELNRALENRSENA